MDAGVPACNLWEVSERIRMVVVAEKDPRHKEAQGCNENGGDHFVVNGRWGSVAGSVPAFNF